MNDRLPAYHLDVLAHLRYWPQRRLERDVAAVLATGHARARAIATVLQQAHIAPDDIAPSQIVSRGYLEAATFTLCWRLRDLQRARGRAEHADEPISESPAPEPTTPPSAPRPSRRRRRPKPPRAAAIAAGDTAGARVAGRPGRRRHRRLTPGGGSEVTNSARRAGTPGRR